MAFTQAKAPTVTEGWHFGPCVIDWDGTPFVVHEHEAAELIPTTRGMGQEWIHVVVVRPAAVVRAGIPDKDSHRQGRHYPPNPGARGEHRKWKPPFRCRFGPNGKALCGYCGTEVKGRRTSWCSDECAHNGWIRMSAASMRTHVFERDKGFCALCGVDATAVWGPWRERSDGRRLPPYPRALEWEADHVVPLIEGGDHGPDNVRTLCVPCHKDETRELAGRRARARSRQGTLPLG